MALFTGRVLDTGELTNGWSGATFLWARVRTLGGEVDVVADPEIVTGDATVGGVAQGEFWMSGRLPSGQGR
jgi:head-tail adaptor